MTERKNDKRRIASKVPMVSDLEGHFSFIEDDILRQNIAVSFQYIIFLIAVIDRERIEESTISSSIYKNMIMYTATVVESCLHYCLKECIARGDVKSSGVMSSEKVLKDVKVIHKINNNQEAIGAIRLNKAEKLKDKTGFIVVNRACEKAGIIDKQLFKDVDVLRKTRNNIHLMGLRNVDCVYKQEDVQKVFKIAKKIIKVVNQKLTVPNK